MPESRFRTLLVIGTVLALAGAHAPRAAAQVPAPDKFAPLDQRLARSPRIRTLTLAGFIEAESVQLDSAGLTYHGILSATSRDMALAPGMVTWDELLGVDAQVNRAGRTAAGLGSLLCLTGLVGGIFSDIVDGSSENAFPAAAIGAATGAILGAAIGSTIHVWVRIHPPPSSMGTTQRVAMSLDTTHSAQARRIAIAPLANFTGRTQAAKESQKIREGIYRELTRRSASRSLSVEPLAETDQKLRDASPDTSTGSRLPPSEICKVLGADAVVMGAITTYSHSKAGADLAIYDGASGKRIWLQDVNKSGKAIGATIAEAFPAKRKSGSPR